VQKPQFITDNGCGGLLSISRRNSVFGSGGTGGSSFCDGISLVAAVVDFAEAGALISAIALGGG
jgi:hypothetical protein